MNHGLHGLNITMIVHLITLLHSTLIIQDKASSSSAQLGLANLGGVFIVLLGGMFLSIVIALFEFSWKRRRLAVDENVSELKWLKYVFQ